MKIAKNGQICRKKNSDSFLTPYIKISVGGDLRRMTAFVNITARII